MINTDYSVVAEPALCRLYIHDGLITTITKSYDDLQDALECNCEVLREVLIRKPGLRAVGGAFSSRVNGNNLYITLGHAVFADYSIFVPSSTNQVVKIVLPDPDDIIDPNAILYAVISHETIDSHPYDKKAMLGTTTSVDVATRDTAKIEILDSVGSDSLIICELAKVNGGWEHTNVSALHLLEVTSSRLTSDFDSGAIGDLEIRSYCMSQLKPSSHIIGTDAVAIDKEGNVASEAVGAVISCSWHAPRPEIEGRKGNIAYYMIRAVPRNSEGAAAPAQTISVAVFHHYDTDGPIVRASLPCANGTIYDVSLYELDDTLGQVVHGPVATGIAIGGIYDATASSPDLPTLSVAISQPFTPKNVLKIRPILQNSTMGPYVCQVFVREYATEPTVPLVSITDRGSLIYEGPAMPIYHIADPSRPYGVVEIRAIQWRGNRLVTDAVKTLVALDASGSFNTSGNEVILSVAATNVIPDSAATSTIVAQWHDTPNLNLSRIVCSMPVGCNLDGEKMWGNTGGDVLIADGGTIELVDNKSFLIAGATLTFDDTGYAETTFEPMINIPEQTLLSLRISHATQPCLPLLMQVTLYIDDGWGWR